MAGKRGARWGEQLPRQKKIRSGLRPTNHQADVANGEPVPRCRSCGVAGTEANPIRPGLWMYIRFAMPLDLCLRCALAFAPEDSEVVDPMQLHDAA